MVILSISFYQNFPLWLMLIFISGMSWFCITTLRYSWANNLLFDKSRAKILGIFSSVMCLGLTLGPIIVKFIGAGNYLNFVISSFCISLSCLILLLIKAQQPKIDKPLFENKILQIIKKDYRIFFARFLLDFHSIILVIFTVIYGMSNNFSAEDAGLLVSAFMGIGLFDFIIGFLINPKFYNRYFNIGFSGCLISIIALHFLIHNYYTAVLIYIIYGWFSSLIFITAMSSANNNKKSANAVAINSALQASGSFGSVVGILFGGILIELFEGHGFIISIALCNLTFLIINFLTRNKK
jgi:MFS family permease